MNRLVELHEIGGQSPWMDYIRRDILENGELQSWIQSGVRGVTSNPTILENAIAKSDLYVADIRTLANRGFRSDQIYEQIAIADITRACDQFLPLYEASNGGDGFVSLEVSPALSHDSEGSIAEGLRLWQTIDRPNLMIKIPATEAGVVATQALIAAGVNVNVTLMFSEEDYHAVAEAYLSGLEARMEQGLSCNHVHSVASLFVSRVDTWLMDTLMQRADLLGRVAIANARLMYRSFQKLFSSSRFLKLQSHGAHLQRPLFASTGTKSSHLSDVWYVNNLILPHSVNTMPTQTLTAFLDHGTVAEISATSFPEDERIVSDCNDLGIDLTVVGRELKANGLAQFENSYKSLLQAITTEMGQFQT